MRQADLQADSLAFMYAHEFVEQTTTEEELYNPLAHSIEYPTKAPLSDLIVDRNEVAEKVMFAALADLAAQKRLKLMLRRNRQVLGLPPLTWLAERFGYPRQILWVQRDGSFPNSPLNSALNNLFDSLLVPGSDFISEPQVPVRTLLKKLFQHRDKERDPYHDIIQWVGDVLIDEGYYQESTEVVVGTVPFKEAHPDLEKMRDCADRVTALRERLATFERREPELYVALKQTVAETMKEISVLFSRRFTL